LTFSVVVPGVLPLLGDTDSQPLEIAAAVQFSAPVPVFLTRKVFDAGAGPPGSAMNWNDRGSIFDLGGAGAWTLRDTFTVSVEAPLTTLTAPE
jgi:hypothetical protein